MIIWISGNSKSGKTTLARQLQTKSCVILDGDDIRDIYPTGLTMPERIEHNYRVGKLATLIHSFGVDVIVASICPSYEVRENLKKLYNIGFIYLDGGLSGRDYPYEKHGEKYFQKNIK